MGLLSCLCVSVCCCFVLGLWVCRCAVSLFSGLAVTGPLGFLVELVCWFVCGPVLASSSVCWFWFACFVGLTAGFLGFVVVFLLVWQLFLVLSLCVLLGPFVWFVRLVCRFGYVVCLLVSLCLLVVWGRAVPSKSSQLSWPPAVARPSSCTSAGKASTSPPASPS